ncbi:MAG TPA: hypothetical protein ENN67_01975 [Firmicutes bacterium]|nr:hypothetical protein [Bacillota bacterium]
MRKLISLILLTAMFVIPMLTSCVPSGYEGENPARPSDFQVTGEAQPETDPNQPVPDDTTEQPAEETGE